MADKMIYHDSMNLPSYDDKIIFSNNFKVILNFSNDIAKQIKEQVIDTIEQFIDLTP